MSPLSCGELDQKPNLNIFKWLVTVEQWGFLLCLTKYSTMLCLAVCAVSPPALLWDGVVLIRFHRLHWIFCVHTDSWSWQSGSQVVLNNVVTNACVVIRGGSGEISSSFFPNSSQAFGWLEATVSVCRIPALLWPCGACDCKQTRRLPKQRFGHSPIQSQWLRFPCQHRCQLRGCGSPAAALLLLMPVTY